MITIGKRAAKQREKRGGELYNRDAILQARNSDAILSPNIKIGSATIFIPSIQLIDNYNSYWNSRFLRTKTINVYKGIVAKYLSFTLMSFSYIKFNICMYFRRLI
jgi:hypothetical protein